MLYHAQTVIIFFNTIYNYQIEQFYFGNVEKSIFVTLCIKISQQYNYDSFIHVSIVGKYNNLVSFATLLVNENS